MGQRLKLMDGKIFNQTSLFLGPGDVESMFLLKFLVVNFEINHPPSCRWFLRTSILVLFLGGLFL